MTYKPLIFAVLIAGLLYGALAIRGCTTPQPVSKTETTAEQQLQRHKETEVVARSDYRADTMQTYYRFKALQRERDSLMTQLSTLAPKAQHSAQEYQKTPTLGNCDKALKDCQGESEVKGYALAVQDKMIREGEQASNRDRKEIARSYVVTDSLAKGWDAANRDLRKEKGKKWGVGVQAGYGAGKAGFSPYVGVGISYNLIRF